MKDDAPSFDEAWFASRASRSVQGLRAYDPGHDLVSFRKQFGVANLIELGSNENPYGPSPAAREAILDSLHALHRYPDPLGADLKRALAAKHGVDVKQILLGNGSHELLMQLAQVFANAGDDVVFSRYGFAVFAIATQAAGATARVVEALPRDATMPCGHDLDAIAAAITPATKLVYLANPNNPTGTWFSREALTAFLARVPSEVIVVMDEAYGEMAFAPSPAKAGEGWGGVARDPTQLTGENTGSHTTPSQPPPAFAGGGAELTALPLLAAHPNVVITRTFSKAYGLAGLRVGYLLGAPGLVAVMERIRESFNVNGPALAACEAALGDEAHLQWSCERNAEERVALSEALQARGLRVFPSQTNFVLVEFGPRTAEIEKTLVSRGVVLRPMGGYGLGDCLRITVGNRDENRRLLAALDPLL